jgi:hypothetical protein
LPSAGVIEGDIQYTKSGKLFSFTDGGIFKSDDKGTQLAPGNHRFGLLYRIFRRFFNLGWNDLRKTQYLIQSIDGGETFRPVYTFEHARLFFHRQQR